MEDKMKTYQRRKNETNVRAKKSSRSYRFIVNRSNKYNYGQIIDGEWKTIVMASDRKKDWAEKTKKERAKQLGIDMAKKAQEKWVIEVVFDRNWYLYHGRVAAIAEWLREGGLVV